MKFLVSTVYSLLLLIVWKTGGAQGIQGTISPSSLIIDEAPYAATLDQLLANLTRVSLSNSPSRVMELFTISADCFPAVTVNFTCSFTSASSIMFVRLWVKRDGSTEFERAYQFVPNVLNSDSDNFTVEFQQTAQLREIGDFRELAGEYMCRADTGAETANATIEVLYRPIFIHETFDDQGEVLVLRDSEYFLLTAKFIVEGINNVTLPIAFVGANPPPSSFNWMRNDQPLLSLDGSGSGSGGDGGRLIGTGTGVMLHSPRRSDSGVYQVSASNTGGTGSLNALLVVRFPPEFKAPERVLYVRAGDRLQLNCTPDAHSSSGGNVPSYDLEDRTGPAAITQLSYRFSKNGSEIMSPSLGSSGLLNVTDVANMTDSGMYSCVVEDAVYRKEARFRFLARRKRGVVQISTFSILEGVTQSLLASPRLSATVSFSVVVGDVPVAPRALIVAVTSPNSVVASWVPAQMVQTDPLLPIHYEVTLTDLGTGQILRRSNVSSADGVGRPEQLYDNLVPGSYGIAVTAGNVFGRSKNLSLNFNITERNCFYFYALIASAVVLLAVLLLVGGLVAGLMYAIRQARATAPLSGDLPVALESQNMKDKSVHGHLSGHSLQGTSGEHNRSTSFSRPGGAEEGEDAESGEVLILETNPAYACQSGTFIADTNANIDDTHEPSSAFSMGVRDSEHSGNDEIGSALTAVQGMNVGARRPNDEAGVRVSGVDESTVDIDANDVYDVVL